MTTKVTRKRPANAEPAKHPLAHLIPDPWYAEEYVSRKISGVQDVIVLNKAHEHKANVIIAGPTGSAKTSVVYAMAAGFTGEIKRKRIDGEMVDVNVVDPDCARPVIYIPCNGAIEPSQLLGRHVPQADGSYLFVPGDLLLAVIHGGIIYVDEINFMVPRMASVLHGLLDKRRTLKVLDAKGSGLCATCGLVNGGAVDVCACGEEIGSGTDFKAHPDCQIIAAYNPNYRGTIPPNEALLNRFAFPIEFGYDKVVEESLLYSGHLIEMAEKLREMAAEGEIRTPVSTNALIEFETFALDDDLGFGFACENFLNRFPVDERESIKQVVEAHTAGMNADLFADDDDDDEAEDAMLAAELGDDDDEGV